MEEKKKKNYVIPVIGALIAVVACVAYIVMKFASQQQQLEDKWSEYDDCGWMYFFKITIEISVSL